MEYPFAQAEVFAVGSVRYAIATDEEGNRRRIERADVVTTVDGAVAYVESAELTKDEELRITGNSKSYFVGPSRVRRVSPRRHIDFADEKQRDRFIAELFKRGRMDLSLRVTPTARADVLLGIVLFALKDAILDDRGDATVGHVVELDDADFTLVTEALLAAKAGPASVEAWLARSTTDATAETEAEDRDQEEPGFADQAQLLAVRDVLAVAAGYRVVTGTPEWQRYVGARGAADEPTLAQATLWELAEAMKFVPFAAEKARLRPFDEDVYHDDPFAFASGLTQALHFLVSGLDAKGARMAFTLLRAVRSGARAVGHWLDQHRSPVPQRTRRIVAKR